MNKKWLKRSVCLGIVGVLWFHCAAFYKIDLIGEEVLAAQSEEADLEEIDLFLAAHYYLSSSDIDSSCWEGNPQLSLIEPLYDDMDDVVAYYVKLSNGAYAVINNNINNPAAIEFGMGDNEMIEDILSTKTDDVHIIYASPNEVASSAGETFAAMPVLQGGEGLYDHYPDLLEEDIKLVEELRCQKDIIMQGASTFSLQGDGDYGIYDASNLPASRYNNKNIALLSNIDWAIYQDYDYFAKNHCGAVCITNIVLFFARNGYSNLKIRNTDATFNAVYAMTGDGPIMSISETVRSYCSQRGVTVYISPLYNYSDVENAITNNHPCGLLLKDALLNWHWVLGVGWRTYMSDGSAKYIRVVDGWNNTTDRYYKWNEKAEFYFGNEYWT